MYILTIHIRKKKLYINVLFFLLSTLRNVYPLGKMTDNYSEICKTFDSKKIYQLLVN